MSSKSIVAILLGITLVAIYLLATGSSLLNKVPFNSVPMPFGNIVTAAGMLSLPLSIFFGFESIRNPKTRSEQVIANGIKLNIAVAACWIPVSYLLAGNLTFSFTGTPAFQGGQQAMRIFWTNSALIICLPLLCLLGYALMKLVRKRGE